MNAVRAQTETYREHVAAVADEIGCRLRLGPGLVAMMFVDDGFVQGPTVETQSEYALVLHELGHFACGHTTALDGARRYFTNGVLRSEAEAWEFALDHFLDRPTPATRMTMLDCIHSYERAAIRAAGAPTRHPLMPDVEVVFDEPDDYYFSILERMRRQ